MEYKAMPGSIIIQIDAPKEQVSARDSGLFVVEKPELGHTTVAKVLSVGDEREDLKAGMSILFPTATGLKIDKTIYYLKYEDICAIIVS